MICEVCKRPIDPEEDAYVHHHRLNVDIHFSCPLTDVRGEDVSLHVVYYHNMRNWNKKK